MRMRSRSYCELEDYLAQVRGCGGVVGPLWRRAWRLQPGSSKGQSTPGATPSAERNTFTAPS